MVGAQRDAMPTPGRRECLDAIIGGSPICLSTPLIADARPGELPRNGRRRRAERMAQARDGEPRGARRHAAFETALEDSQPWVVRLRPPAQRVLSAWLGAGNERVYIGRDGWLFYRPDVE